MGTESSTLARNPAKTFTNSTTNGIKFIRENEKECCLQQKNSTTTAMGSSNSYRLVATADNSRFNNICFL
jgi:hypothetical protein